MEYHLINGFFDYDEIEGQKALMFTIFSMTRSHDLHKLLQRFCRRDSETSQNVTKCIFSANLIILRNGPKQFIARKLGSSAVIRNLLV